MTNNVMTKVLYMCCEVAKWPNGIKFEHILIYVKEMLDLQIL